METLLHTLFDIFDEVQRHSGCHQRNLVVLLNLYNKTPFEEFLEAFIRCLKLSFIGANSLNHQSVKRFIHFSTHFIGSVVQHCTASDDDSQASTHPFLRTVAINVLKMHSEKDVRLRIHSCNFIACLLSCIGDDANLDNDLCDDIQEGMLRRIREPHNIIRKNAVSALHRLQDPYNEQCPVIQAYFKCFNDPNADVRETAVVLIAPSSFAIPRIFENVLDINHKVRRATFIKFSTLSPDVLNIASRQQMCVRGFEEQNPMAKKAFLAVLLPKWLAAYDDNFLKFLSAIKLDADENDVDTTATVTADIMDEFLKHHAIKDILKFLPLNDNKLVPLDKLCSEVVSYWSILHKQALKNDDYEDILHTVVPELTIFCNYIERLISEKSSRNLEAWQCLEYQFILLKLFEIASRFDFSDEVGRQRLNQLVCDTLTSTRLRTEVVQLLVSILEMLSDTTDHLIENVVDIITNIKEPYVEVLPTAEESQKRNFALAELNVQINVLNDDIEDAIRERDMRLAAQKEDELKSCLAKKTQLLADADVPKQIQQSTSEPSVQCRYLEVLLALLRLGAVNKMSALLTELKDEFLSNIEKSNDIEVHRKIYKCCLLFSVIDENSAKEFIRLIYTPILLYNTLPEYDKPTLINAVRGISDLLVLYGPKLFGADEEQSDMQNTTSRNGQNQRKLYQSSENAIVSSANKEYSADMILDILVTMLDEESLEIRQAAGISISHLLVHGVMVSSGLLSRILLQWFNPLTKHHSPKMFEIFSLSISYFASCVKGSEYTLEKAVVPTLNAIGNAPKTSPLTDVNVDYVITILCHLTSTERRNQIVDSHKTLTYVLCREIETNGDNKCMHLWLKMLLKLNMSIIDKESLKEIKLQIEGLIQNTSVKVYKDKLTKYLSGIIRELEIIQLNSQLETINEEPSSDNIQMNPTGEAAIEVIKPTNLCANEEQSNNGKRKIDEMSENLNESSKTVDKVHILARNKHKPDLQSNREDAKQSNRSTKRCKSFQKTNSESDSYSDVSASDKMGKNPRKKQKYANKNGTSKSPKRVSKNKDDDRSNKLILQTNSKNDALMTQIQQQSKPNSKIGGISSSTKKLTKVVNISSNTNRSAYGTTNKESYNSSVDKTPRKQCSARITSESQKRTVPNSLKQTQELKSASRISKGMVKNTSESESDRDMLSAIKTKRKKLKPRVTKNAVPKLPKGTENHNNSRKSKRLIGRAGLKSESEVEPTDEDSTLLVKNAKNLDNSRKSKRSVGRIGPESESEDKSSIEDTPPIVKNANSVLKLPKGTENHSNSRKSKRLVGRAALESELEVESTDEDAPSVVQNAKNLGNSRKSKRSVGRIGPESESEDKSSIEDTPPIVKKANSVPKLPKGTEKYNNSRKSKRRVGRTGLDCESEVESTDEDATSILKKAKNLGNSRKSKRSVGRIGPESESEDISTIEDTPLIVKKANSVLKFPKGTENHNHSRKSKRGVGRAALESESEVESTDEDAPSIVQNSKNLGNSWKSKRSVGRIGLSESDDKSSIEYTSPIVKEANSVPKLLKGTEKYNNSRKSKRGAGRAGLDFESEVESTDEDATSIVKNAKKLGNSRKSKRSVRRIGPESESEDLSTIEDTPLIVKNANSVIKLPKGTENHNNSRKSKRLAGRAALESESEVESTDEDAPSIVQTANNIGNSRKSKRSVERIGSESESENKSIVEDTPIIIKKADKTRIMDGSDKASQKGAVSKSLKPTKNLNNSTKNRLLKKISSKSELDRDEPNAKSKGKMLNAGIKIASEKATTLKVPTLDNIAEGKILIARSSSESESSPDEEAPVILRSRHTRYSSPIQCSESGKKSSSTNGYVNKAPRTQQPTIHIIDNIVIRTGKNNDYEKQHTANINRNKSNRTGKSDTANKKLTTNDSWNPRTSTRRSKSGLDSNGIHSSFRDDCNGMNNNSAKSSSKSVEKDVSRSNNTPKRTSAILSNRNSGDYQRTLLEDGTKRFLRLPDKMYNTNKTRINNRSDNDDVNKKNHKPIRTVKRRRSVLETSSRNSSNEESVASSTPITKKKRKSANVAENPVGLLDVSVVLEDICARRIARNMKTLASNPLNNSKVRRSARSKYQRKLGGQTTSVDGDVNEKTKHVAVRRSARKSIPVDDSDASSVAESVHEQRNGRELRVALRRSKRQSKTKET